MSLNNYIRISALSLICFLSSMPPVSAQWPTLDMSAIGQDMKSITQQIEQYKTQLMESKTVGSINSTIGDAKSSMSKFSADDLEAAKKKAEKAKKQAEKIKKIQDDIKKAKEEYEEKKKQFEEYKQQVADAKEMVNDVKDIASSAGDLAGQAISDVKDKVSSSTGVKLPSSSSSAAVSSPVSSVSAGNTASMSAATKNIAAGVSQMSVGMSSGAPSNISAAASLQGGTVAKLQGTSGSLQPVSENISAKTLSPASGLMASVPLQTSETGALAASGGLSEKTAAPAVKGRTAFTDMKAADAINKADLADNKTETLINNVSPVAAGESSVVAGKQADLTSLKERMNEAKASLNKAGAVSVEVGTSVDTARKIGESQGAAAGVATLKSSLNKAINRGDVQTLNAIANVDTGDIITSDSKVYQPSAAQMKATAAQMKAASAQVKAANVQAKAASAQVRAAVSRAGTAAAQVNAPAATQMKATAAQMKAASAQVKAANIQAKAASAQVRAAVSRADTAAAQVNALAATQKTIGRKAFTTPALSVSDSIGGKAPVLKSLDKESSLWLNDGGRTVRSSVRLSYADTLVYGDAECSYKNFIVSADDGEIVILPKTLAKECCLQAEELKDLNVIKDCANKMLVKMNDSDSTVAAEANGVFNQILAEQNLYGLAEALDNTNASTSYQADVLKQYKEDMKSASTTGDDISSVSMTNTQLLFLFNRIRRIYTSALAATGISGLDSVNADTLNEDTDIGLDGVEGEYEFSVTRNEMEYPIIPENMAKKCALKFNEGIDKVKECYMDAVRNMHAADFKDAEVGKNYVDNITYQNILDVLAKSLYQRVKSAQYDEQLEKTKETNADATTIRTKGDGLFNTDYEIQEAIDDIVNMLASRVAHSSLTSMSKLNPLSTEEKSNSAQKEG